MRYVIEMNQHKCLIAEKNLGNRKKKKKLTTFSSGASSFTAHSISDSRTLTRSSSAVLLLTTLSVENLENEIIDPRLSCWLPRISLSADTAPLRRLTGDLAARKAIVATVDEARRNTVLNDIFGGIVGFSLKWMKRGYKRLSKCEGLLRARGFKVYYRNWKSLENNI